MVDFRCEQCGKDFSNADALSMHNRAKHPETHREPVFTPQRKRRLRNWAIALVIVFAVGWGIFALLSGGGREGGNVPLDVTLSPEALTQVPKGLTHWHPHLTIVIDGKQIPIPKDIGITVGRVVDTYVGGDMGMTPSHTHDGSGTIQLENLDPSKKPETLALGYFFYVWDKVFNSSCIFEYCTDRGTLVMTVNGKENMEFQNYFMKDKDMIRIAYTSRASGGA